MFDDAVALYENSMVLEDDTRKPCEEFFRCRKRGQKNVDEKDPRLLAIRGPVLQYRNSGDFYTVPECNYSSGSIDVCVPSIAQHMPLDWRKHWLNLDERKVPRPSIQTDSAEKAVIKLIACPDLDSYQQSGRWHTHGLAVQKVDGIWYRLGRTKSSLFTKEANNAPKTAQTQLPDLKGLLGDLPRQTILLG